MTTRTQQPRTMRRWVYLLFLATVVASLYVCRVPVLCMAGHWLDVGEHPRVCDYVLVLPGAPETRPFVAAAMVKGGLARQVLVPKTETAPLVTDGIWPASHELNQAVLMRRGVPSADILFLEGISSSTFDDAQLLRSFLKERPSSTVAVVTSNYHTRRSRWVFRQTLGSEFSQVYFVSAPTDRFHAENWWRVKMGMLTYLSEYAKFVLYLFRYGGPVVWCAPAFAIFALLLVRRFGQRLPTSSLGHQG